MAAYTINTSKTKMTTSAAGAEKRKSLGLYSLATLLILLAIPTIAVPASAATSLTLAEPRCSSSKVFGGNYDAQACVEGLSTNAYRVTAYFTNGTDQQVDLAMKLSLSAGSNTYDLYTCPLQVGPRGNANCQGWRSFSSAPSGPVVGRVTFSSSGRSASITSPSLSDASGTVPSPSSSSTTRDQQVPATGCEQSATALIALVNAYRTQNGLPAIPASPSLCTVAAAHTRDLAENAPHTAPGCNLHSWSDKGHWTSCCYTPDQKQGACMWNKPRELTGYTGDGFENAFQGSSQPEAALASWKSSGPHNDVILNRGIWASHPWRAIGANLHGGFAMLWFGDKDDPAR